MKKLLIPLAALVLCVSTPPAARAQGSISVDFFYDNLQPHGQWLDVGDYGYAWQPNDMQSDWSPYSDGRWVYTDAGWTWDSYEPFGWAVYHYGRWANVRQVGWVWVPGTEWAPAWVSWRHSPTYVGWAPLPPEARFSVSIGFNSWVDDYYDIGPAHYRFVEGRNFGSPHLNRSFVDRGRNLTLINETTNITNITYRNNVIHNGGPVYEDQVRLSREPISRYTLDRRQKFEGDLRKQTPDQLRSRVEGESFIVAAPTLVASASPRSPETVAKTVEDVEIDRGWADAGSAEEVAALREERRAKATAEVPAGLPKEPKFEGSVEGPSAVGAETGNARDKGKGIVRPGNETTATRPSAPGAAAPDQPVRPGRMTESTTDGRTDAPRPPTPGKGSVREKGERPDSSLFPGATTPPVDGKPIMPEKGTPAPFPSSPQSPAQPPRPSTPGRDDAKGKSDRPNSAPRPDVNTPGEERRPGQPGPGARDAVPQGTDPQAQPPRRSTPGSDGAKGKSERPTAAPRPGATTPGEERRPGRPETNTPEPDRTAPAPRSERPQSAPQDPAGRSTQREPNPDRSPRAGGKGKGIPAVPPFERPVEDPEKEKGKSER